MCPKDEAESDAILTADLDTRIRAREEEEEERRRQKKERKKDKKVKMKMANLFVGALIGVDSCLLLSYAAFQGKFVCSLTKASSFCCYLQKPNAANDDMGDMDPEMAAMMGFGGFGSSKQS
jgi:hypothetical protein